jgi:predicted pyridoxine 5'-phosphate oxidase superfamily flavin-nucleotide-binding protein
MAHRFSEIAFTPAVRAAQAAHGSARAYESRLAGETPFGDRLGEPEAEFIAARDSFYMASVGETGWPYVQHRGGPAGFLKVLDETTLGFADFRGNRQYVSLGNVTGDDRVCLFLMDYANRARLKLFGHARITNDPADLARLASAGYAGKVERGWLIEVSGFDWNCPQHITPRFAEAEVIAGVTPLHRRIAELEAEFAALKSANMQNKSGHSPV